MPVTLVPLSPNHRSMLESLALGCYLDGQCGEFAIALHRGLGWQMLAIEKDGNPFRHVFLEHPNKRQYFDVRGPVSGREIGKPFGLRIPLPIRKIGEDELLSGAEADGGPIEDCAIERAIRFAQALWPDLPWRPDTPQRKILAFMEEFEALCRRHNVYVRGSSAGPIVYEGDGIENGYDLTPTIDGLSYTFVRRLRA